MNTTTDPQIVLDLIVSFRCSKVMFAAVSLGVFDALSDGPKSGGTLAAELHADTDALVRLLDACVGLGLLVHTAAGYENAAAANTYLCSASPQRLTGYINYSNDVMWKLWGNLEDAIREGSNRWKQTYGWDGPIFSHFFRTDSAKREFLMGMHGFGLISSPEVVTVFDLSQFQCLVDLGGATGHLAIAACHRYPSLRAVVFDLEDSIPLARDTVTASSASNRIELCAGDFFVDPLPHADLFAVSRILHDWSEDKILRLLARIFHQLPRNGAILVAEKLLDPDKTGPRWAQMQSLNMLVCTEGKERTFNEYEKLLHAVGFTDVVARTTTSPLDAVLAFKR